MRPDPHPNPSPTRGAGSGTDLVLDVGSTLTKAALARCGEVTRLATFRTVHHGWPARLARLLDRAGAVDRVVVSSVAPATTAALRGLGSTWGPGVPLAFLDAATAPLVVDYRPLGSLGTDRIAAAVAAQARWGAPVVVVDVGTAITCDAVDTAGRFVGGAIAPGPATAYGGLSARAPHLGRVPDPLGGGAGPLPLAGTSTGECLRLGVVRGSAALVDGLVRDLRRLVGPGPAVATGGLAGVIAAAGEEITDVDPDLTLRGIHLAVSHGDRRPRS